MARPAEVLVSLADAPRMRRWLHAVKPASWPKLFAPAILGQAIGFADGGRFSVLALLAGLAFTALDAAAIVLLNDWGDREVDAIKRKRWPESGSPKTIPDGILPAGDVLFGGLFAGVLLLALAFRAGPPLGRPAFGAMAVVSLVFVALYTFQPVRLNYRGGGELLEAAGVGVILPAIHAYLQSGQIASARVIALAPGLFALALSSAVASGLSDEDSDRLGGKRTFTTMFGNAASRAAVHGCLIAGALALLVGAAATRGATLGAAVPAALVLLASARPLLAASPSAITRAWSAQSVYKGVLHRALWGGQLAMTVGVVAQRLLGL